MMARERARLAIDFPPKEPRIDGIKFKDVDGTVSQLLELYINVINHGGSKAFNVKASGYVMTENIEAGKFFPTYGQDLSIPKVIGIATDADPVRLYLAPIGLGTKVQILSKDWVDIQKGNKPLHVVGTIDYEDVFGKPHRTPFWHTWKVRTDNANWGYEAEWTDTSSASN